MLLYHCLILFISKAYKHYIHTTHIKSHETIPHKLRQCDPEKWIQGLIHDQEAEETCDLVDLSSGSSARAASTPNIGTISPVPPD